MNDKEDENAEGVRLKTEPFQGLIKYFNRDPGLSLRSNPGLELANAFGVNSSYERLNHNANIT
jgi:hypothetical protein